MSGSPHGLPETIGKITRVLAWSIAGAGIKLKLVIFYASK
jgi:hypothetical protein